MSQRDLPLWARGVAAVLLVIASWWLVETETLRIAVGDSIALLSLGVVSASILRGMHLPLGLWPDGPRRQTFSKSLIVGAAVLFGAGFVIFDPGSAALFEAIDRGVFVLVILGVLGWGFAWAFIQQRGFLPWYALGAAAAIAPFVAGLLGAEIRGGEAGALCAWSVQQVVEGSACDAPALRTLGFMAAIGASSALVTLELTFRRLLIGRPSDAGLVLILVAAVPYALWVMLVSPDMPGLEAPVWLGVLGAIGAGCLYVLSNSLLVSALYTGILFGGYEALVRAMPDVLAGAMPIGWEYSALNAVAVIGLAAAVHWRRGLFSGLR